MTDSGTSEHTYLTVKELAELLRLKERKIYDLAATGQVPCSRATGKLLFPAKEIRDWIDGAKTGSAVPARARPPIVLGSHDPLLDWAIRQSGCGLATYFDGSFDGLTRFCAAEGVATGLHIRDTASGDWNIPAVRAIADGQNAVLIGFASRSRGLIHRGDGPAPGGLADLAGLRVVPRQAEAGSDRLFRDMAAQAGLDLSRVRFSAIARTEDEAAEAVRRGEADVAFGLACVASGFGLGFVPLIEEPFALLVDRKAWFDPPMQKLLAFCRADPFAEHARRLGGYDISAFGTVILNV